MTRTEARDEDEFVTIIGRDAEEISKTFRAEGLADQQFTIVHRIGRHRFAFADGGPNGGMFDGRPVLAATYARRTRG
ncbi:MAG: hypothetical protein K0R27_4124 [Xanthobacteraceae bacterium]|jgi:hypothetical protein|nr:hypothetical protein [Xanthobacteraceae bacterium]